MIQRAHACLSLGFVVTVFLLSIISLGFGAEEEGKKRPAPVRVKLEVELRGTLTFEGNTAIVAVRRSRYDGKHYEEYKEPWILDFGKSDDLRRKAKALAGKPVVLLGKATFSYAAVANDRPLRHGIEAEPHYFTQLIAEYQVAVAEIVAVEE
jgi:hypothetical protein